MAVWPPSAAPMAQGLPGSPGSGTGGPVAALAAGEPDGVDRREVEDVEAQLVDVRQPSPDIGERAVPIRVR